MKEFIVVIIMLILFALMFCAFYRIASKSGLVMSEKHHSENEQKNPR